MAVYGLVNYDVAKVYEVDKVTGTRREVPRKAATAIPTGLRRLGWLKAGSKSSYSGDLSRRDEVMKLLSSNLDNPNDVHLPPLRVAKESENEIRAWVRTANRQFFDEVVARIRKSIDPLIERIDAEGEKALGIGDVASKFDTKVKRAQKQLEEVMVGLATFRLSEEFDDFYKAKLAEIDLMQNDVCLALMKKSQEKEREEKSKEAATK